MVEMERSNRHRSRQRNKARKAPKVPIKTWRWEDVRRARKRGGYPWTHLYKKPFNEVVDPDQFTMDAFRRAKSSSPMGRVDISEVSSWADYSGKTTPTLLQELINEPLDNVTAAKTSGPGSVVIEEIDDDSPASKLRESRAGSAGSSVISQYLDKEELESAPSTKPDKAARSAEEPEGEKKRRKSIESSHSRYSLSQLGVVKKLQEVKRKIKVPKVSFPTKKKPRKRISPPKEEKLKKQPKKLIKPQEPVKPVYIYIPLKPPPGQSDEFSHLEFQPKEGEKEIKPPLKINPAMKQLLKDVRKLKNKEQENAGRNQESAESREESAELQSSESQPQKQEGNATQAGEPENVIEVQANEELRKQPEDFPLEQKPFEHIPSADTPKADPQIEKKPADAEAKVEESFHKDEEPVEDPLPGGGDDISSDPDVFDNLFKASASKAGPSKPPLPRNVRSRSAEPQAKRRHSLESSYSRKSLSQLAFVKKLKEASERIRNAFSMDNLKRRVSSTRKRKQEEEKLKEKLKEEEKGKHKRIKQTNLVKLGQLSQPKKVEPVYIHIPLKPPEGETDEFSYLSEEPVTQPEPKKDERTDSLDSTTPSITQGDGVHFIFLTPPSDDELLDKDPDIPETPSSDEGICFTTLRKLAKDAVDQVSPEDKKILETVSEEVLGEKISEVGDLHENGTVKQAQPQEQMVVDVEDGLNEAATKTEDVLLKSAIKSSDSAGQKRVSFKRKSKGAKEKKDEDSGYEVIEPPKEEPPKPESCLEIEAEEVLAAGDLNVSVEEGPSGLAEDDSHEDNKWSNDTGNRDFKVSVHSALMEPSRGFRRRSFSGGQADRSLSEGSRRRPRKTDISRESSTGSSVASLDVRCACQYYKSDQLLPDRNAQTGRRPVSHPVSNEVLNIRNVPATKTVHFRDHEYEPISAPEDLTVNVSIVDGDSDPKVIISATEILQAPADEKKRSFFGRFHRDKGERRKSQSDDTESRSSQNQEREERSKSPNKLQMALKHGAEQIKTKSNQLRDKLHNIHLPKTPELKKPQFKKPDFKRFKLPKIPDTTTLHLPHINLPGARKTSETRTVETRQYSTESNAGDSEQQPKRHRFDLTFGGTFPRFRKTQKPRPSPEVVFATVPRAKKAPPGFPASSEGSDQPSMEFQQVEIDMDLLRRYSGDDDEPDETDNNQDINRADYVSRWQHGNFAPQQGDPSEEERIIGELVEQRFGKLSSHHGNGSETLEERLRSDEERPRYIEIEEEEFDIRMLEKGHMVTDLDNLEEDQEGSSEGSGSLRRRGRLGQLDINSDEFFVVHEIREGFQTPANALAQMNEYDPIGSNRSLRVAQEPAKKAPIKKPKRRKTPHVSQEEIPGDEESIDGLESPSRPKRWSKRVKKRDNEEPVAPYQETITMERGYPHGQRIDFPRESLGILGDDEGDDQELEEYLRRQIVHPPPLVAQPYPPPRKHRSLKSLTQSENESILVEQQAEAAPRRPSRRSRSNTSTMSRKSPPLEDEVFKRQLQENLNDAAPPPLQECVEEPCVQDIRDYMGYSIVDKSKQRDPPLPPPRTPARRKKRSVETEEQKFATVPRSFGERPPVRPLRNYSTLSHVKSAPQSAPYENNDKENVNITQYVEIDDEVNKDLVSGDVIQKMRQRPLPAPPRPPRKPKTSRHSLQDITSQSNIFAQEETVSTQTEPLPPDFDCEEVRQEPTDTILLPRNSAKEDVVVQRFELHDPRKEVRKELITPTQYSFEETVTHGTLVVRPLDGTQLVPEHQLSKERIVPVSKEGSEDETSEVPECFRRLRNPESGDEQVKVLQAEKLQVADMDVDRLRVNQLITSRIVTSEIDSSSITTKQISGKEGPVRLTDIELPPYVLEQFLARQPDTSEQPLAQKKTPTEAQSRDVDVEPPLPPPRGCTLEETSPTSPTASPRTQMLEPEVDDQPPPRPPQPLESSLYLPSQPPASFYALRAKQFVDENIPAVPRRRRHHRSRPVSRSHSTSEELSSTTGGPNRSPRLTRRASEPSISELSGRLIQACGARINNSLKRLIYHLTENLLRNADGNQDLHVFMIILLVLIAGLILLGYGEERTIVHLHHWEFFNSPKDL